MPEKIQPMPVPERYPEPLNPNKFLKDLRKIKKFPGGEVRIIPAECQDEPVMTMIIVRNVHALFTSIGTEKTIERARTKSSEELAEERESFVRQYGEDGGKYFDAINGNIIQMAATQTDVYSIMGRLIKMGVKDVFMESITAEKQKAFDNYVMHEHGALQQKKQSLNSKLKLAETGEQQEQINQELHELSALQYKFEAVYDSLLMAVKEFHRLKRVRVHIGEDPKLEAGARHARASHGSASSEFQNAQQARDHFIIQQAEQSGKPVVIIVVGGNHARYIEQMIKRRNQIDGQRDKPRPINLVVITPNHYPR